MPTGATGQLGLALPVQGELSGTWGDTVNNGITQYTNIAIAATLTLTNDGAVTLANTTGDASASNITSSLTGAGTVTAQFAIVRVTGTLTTAKVVTAPSYSKTYVVVNAATGGIVTFKASGQTGVSIAVGESAFVYYNGTDYVKLAGTVNTGVTSFQTSLSGLTPSTSTTGAVTLAGTLGTSSGGTNLTSFTSGGVVYASSTSALATGSALSFNGTNALTVTANSAELYLAGGSSAAQGGFLSISRGGTAKILLGTASNVLGGGSNTSDDLTLFATAESRFYASSAEGMRLTSTGLGIGTSSPSSYATDARNLVIASSGNTGMTIRSGTTSTGVISFANAENSTSNNGIVSFNHNDLSLNFNIYGTGRSYRFQSAGTEVMRLDSSGNLGLGVTPSAWRSNTPAFQIGSAGVCLFADSGVTAEVGNNVFLNSSSQYIYLRTDAASRYRQYQGVHSWLTAASGTAGNAISFSTAMTLDASGNLALGKTSASYRFDLQGAAGENQTLAGFFSGTNTSRGLTIGLSAGGTGVNDAFAVYNATITGGYAGHIWQAAGTERARISPNGGFAVGTTADPGAGAIYATGNITAYYSDARLKTVSGKIENALDKVAQLSGVYYTNNSVAKSFGYDSDEVQVGVLAQDVEAVLPQIVKAAPFDLDENNNSKSGENYKTVQYERLVPLLIEAINELQAKVKLLENK